MSSLLRNSGEVQRTKPLKKKPVNKWKVAFIIVGLFPAISHLCIFWGPVIVQAFAKSFIDYQTETLTLGNYLRAIQMFFDSSSNLGEGLRNTVIFFFVGVVNTFLGMFAAYMLYKKMLGSKFVRLALYLPTAISGFMIAMIFQQLLVSNGPIIKFLNDTLHLGIPTPLITEAPLAEIIFYDIWSALGGGLIVWFGAMGRIPEEVIEYGRIDGVGPIREFFQIILPLIFPTFATMMTMSLINFFGSSGSIFLFTEGKYGTYTINYWLFDVVYSGSVETYNVAMAAGWILTILSVPLVFGGRKILNKFGEEVEY